jgi:hypothetical protein
MAPTAMFYTIYTAMTHTVCYLFTSSTHTYLNIYRHSPLTHIQIHTHTHAQTNRQHKQTDNTNKQTHNTNKHIRISINTSLIFHLTCTAQQSSKQSAVSEPDAAEVLISARLIPSELQVRLTCLVLSSPSLSFSFFFSFSSPSLFFLLIFFSC